MRLNWDLKMLLFAVQVNALFLFSHCAKRLIRPFSRYLVRRSNNASFFCSGMVRFTSEYIYCTQHMHLHTRAQHIHVLMSLSLAAIRL